jgi:hypothetical protein
MTEFKDTVSIMLTLPESDKLLKLLRLAGVVDGDLLKKLEMANKRLEHQHASNVLYAPQTPKTGSKPY